MDQPQFSGRRPSTCFQALCNRGRYRLLALASDKRLFAHGEAVIHALFIGPVGDSHLEHGKAQYEVNTVRGHISPAALVVLAGQVAAGHMTDQHVSCWPCLAGLQDNVADQLQKKHQNIQ